MTDRKRPIEHRDLRTRLDKRGPALSAWPLDEIVARGNACLDGVARVETYEFASCYLWYDRPLYNAFGDVIRQLQGDTIYLYRDSASPLRDLFHELGHVAGRLCRLVGNSENGYRGRWDSANAKLIAEIGAQRHWSDYLNRYSRAQQDFQANAASETWAELFMLWHLYPFSDEAALLDDTMAGLQDHPVCAAIARLAWRLDLPCIHRQTFTRPADIG